MHTDIPRLRKGGVGAQFWSVYVPAETAKKGTALADTLEQIQLVKTMIARYPDVFEQARTASDVERIVKAGKIASLIGVEGGHSIENSIENLRRLHALGARAPSARRSRLCSLTILAAHDSVFMFSAFPFCGQSVHPGASVVILIFFVSLASCS